MSKEYQIINAPTCLVLCVSFKWVCFLNGQPNPVTLSFREWTFKLFPPPLFFLNEKTEQIRLEELVLSCTWLNHGFFQMALCSSPHSYIICRQVHVLPPLQSNQHSGKWSVFFCRRPLDVGRSVALHTMGLLIFLWCSEKIHSHESNVLQTSLPQKTSAQLCRRPVTGAYISLHLHMYRSVEPFLQILDKFCTFQTL